VPDGTCTVRSYTFDANTNRTRLVSTTGTDPVQRYRCDMPGGSTTSTETHS
jgi:hypothetical protein